MNRVLTIYILIVRQVAKKENCIEYEITKDFADKLLETGCGRYVSTTLVGDSVEIMRIEIVCV